MDRADKCSFTFVELFLSIIIHWYSSKVKGAVNWRWIMTLPKMTFGPKWPYFGWLLTDFWPNFNWLNLRRQDWSFFEFFECRIHQSKNWIISSMNILKTSRSIISTGPPKYFKIVKTRCRALKSSSRSVQKRQGTWGVMEKGWPEGSVFEWIPNIGPNQIPKYYCKNWIFQTKRRPFHLQLFGPSYLNIQMIFGHQNLTKYQIKYHYGFCASTDQNKV